jgi:hypothetical protein
MGKQALTANDALSNAKDLRGRLVRAAIYSDMQVLGGHQQGTMKSLSLTGSILIHTLLAIARDSTAEIMRTALSSRVATFSDRIRASSAVMVLGSILSFLKIASSWSWNRCESVVASLLASEDTFSLRVSLIVADRGRGVGDA